MKILHVNIDNKGATGLTAYKVHQALMMKGVDSQMLVLTKSNNDLAVMGENSKFHHAITNLRQSLEDRSLKSYKERSATTFTTALIPYSGMVKKINALKPDIVHLHCISGGILHIKDLRKIKAPVVWSLHDMWAFTGGCHYDEYCGAYKQTCGKCKVLGSNKPEDLSRKIFEIKANTYNTLQSITFAGSSKWLTKCAIESSLLKEKEVIYLPPPVDTETFLPANTITAREIVNLPKNKKLIVFNAKDADFNAMKGIKEFQKALYKVKADNVELVITGSMREETKLQFPKNVHFMSIGDDVSLRLIYAAADVTVFPSLQENYTSTIMESMACGTPVVAFKMGANPEVIFHKEDGYLAEAFDIEDFAKGIDWVLNHHHYEDLSLKAREKIVSTFDSKTIINRYINLYNEILSLPSIPFKEHIEAIFSGK